MSSTGAALELADFLKGPPHPRALFKLEDSPLPPPWLSLPSPHLSLGSIHTHSKSLPRRTVCFQRKNTLTY